LYDPSRKHGGAVQGYLNTFTCFAVPVISLHIFTIGFSLKNKRKKRKSYLLTL